MGALTKSQFEALEELMQRFQPSCPKCGGHTVGLLTWSVDGPSMEIAWEDDPSNGFKEVSSEPADSRCPVLSEVRCSDCYTTLNEGDDEFLSDYQGEFELDQDLPWEEV